MKMVKTLNFNELEDRKPAHHQVNGLDLVTSNTMSKCPCCMEGAFTEEH